ncbi:hypothetical protein NMYAN_10043 [Nitrosomonas nitrosa]|uniref:Uncharacterized protein n=1 Tax=Nitrosomonas nitrosa TaxID=52442 RepID=A0A8H8YXX4_9PROT|nr:hypothetical protein NMYAN_10043 [Nitrosomonas nitrosa]
MPILRGMQFIQILKNKFSRKSVNLPEKFLQNWTPFFGRFLRIYILKHQPVFGSLRGF